MREPPSEVYHQGMSHMRRDIIEMPHAAPTYPLHTAATAPPPPSVTGLRRPLKSRVVA
jgi:hypothetical protein